MAVPLKLHGIRSVRLPPISTTATFAEPAMGSQAACAAAGLAYFRSSTSR